MKTEQVLNRKGTETVSILLHCEGSMLNVKQRTIRQNSIQEKTEELFAFTIFLI